MKKNQILSINKTKITHIIHLSDIHIPKNTERHDEFLIVFKNLIKTIRKLNLKNSLIVITGDILDNKLNIGVEQIVLLHYLILNLSELFPIIAIIGNHDCIMNSSNNILTDALTPLLTNLQTLNKVFLLKESGCYSYNNINFCLTTMLQKELTKGEGGKFKEIDKINIGLYHGGFKTDFIQNEYNTNNFTFTIEDFEREYDMALLGDIHQRKIYKSKILIQHAGSLLQLKADEAIQKGFILTDIINKKSKEINVENSFGIITVNVDSEGSYDIDKKTLPQFVDLRIKGNIIKQNVLDEIRKSITFGKKNKIIRERNLFNINRNESTIQTMININNTELDIKSLNEKDLIKIIYQRCEELGNLSQLSQLSQNKTKSIYEKVVNLVKNNFVLSSELKHFDLLKFEFSNYGKYGENNKIDFSKYFNKVVGVNGPNGYGKSSIIYCMIYALYGLNYFSLIEGSNKLNNHELINKNHQEMKTKIFFKINEDVYSIEREISLNKKDYVGLTKNNKVLYEIKTATKKDAEKYILELLGDPKELIRSFFDLKGIYSNNFINLNPKERLIRLNDILNINCLNELNEAANILKKNANTEKIERLHVKERFNKYNINTNPSKLTYSIILDFMKKKLNELELKKSELEKTINLIKFQGDTDMTYDFPQLLKKNEKILENKKKLKEKINKDSIEYENLLKKNLGKLIQTNLNKINGFKSNIIDNVFSMNIYEETEKKYNILVKDIKQNKFLIKNNIDKINKLKKSLIKLDESIPLQYKIKKELEEKEVLFKKLEKHKFDKKCKFCMSNELTQQKITLLNEIKLLNKKIFNRKTINKLFQSYEKHSKLNQNKLEEIKTIEGFNEKLTDKINTQEEILQEYTEILQTKKNLIKNNRLNEKIKDLEGLNLIYFEEKERLGNLSYLIRINLDELIKMNKELRQNKYIFLNKIDKINKKDQKNFNRILKKDNLLKTLDKLNEELISVRADLLYIEDYKKMQDISINEVQEYELIIQSIKGDKGIYNDIFNNGCIEIINKMTNDILKNFNMFQIKITVEKDELYIFKKDGTNITQFSTSELNIFNIIFRCVLNSITKKFTSSILFIDEIFDGLETKNKLKCIELIENIRKIYPKIIIISHDELIKNICDKIINIEYKNGYSNIICLDNH